MPLATPTRRMPTPEAVGDLFGDLVGKATAASKRAEIDLNDDEQQWYSAIFVEDDGEVGGACVADINFASYAGAALAMIPKQVADESIKAGTLSENLDENFREVANIATVLVNGPSVPHIKMSGFAAGVPDEVRSLLAVAAGRKSFDVTITDYGSGKFALFAR